MRAWRVHRLDGIGALALGVVAPPPPPGPGEATVSMLAVGLNYPDLLMLTGGYQYRPPLPFTPGMEGVGRIVAVGEGLSGDLLGARVLARARCGLLAEAVTLPLDALRPAPEAFDDVEAAAFTTGALTAWVALVERGRLSAGEHLLVLGAGGGMGLAAVQLAHALGAEVTAAASSEVKLAAAGAAGGGRLIRIDRDAPDLADVKGACDLVFDPVGAALVRPGLSALKRGGRYLVVGFVGGPPVALPTDVALLREIELIGVRAGEAGRRDAELGRRARHAIDALAAEGRLRPRIGLVTGFEDARDAFEAMAGGSLVGKAVVRIAGED